MITYQNCFIFHVFFFLNCYQCNIHIMCYNVFPMVFIRFRANSHSLLIGIDTQNSVKEALTAVFQRYHLHRKIQDIL